MKINYERYASKTMEIPGTDEIQYCIPGNGWGWTSDKGEIKRWAEEVAKRHGGEPVILQRRVTTTAWERVSDPVPIEEPA